MIDLHCHILPGLDEGPREMEEALDMGRIAEREGIRRIVATPHIVDGSTAASEIQRRVDALNERFLNAGIDLHVHRGAHVSASLAPEHVCGHTIGKSEFILIAFPRAYLPVNAREIVFKYVVAGLEPVLTQPERNEAVIKSPGLLEEILQTGGYVQIAAGSLTGDFGPEVRACAVYLLKRGLVDFIASCAHDGHERPPRMRKAFEEAAGLIGRERAERLVLDNPRAVLEGRELERG